MTNQRKIMKKVSITRTWKYLLTIFIFTSCLVSSNAQSSDGEYRLKFYTLCHHSWTKCEGDSFYSTYFLSYFADERVQLQFKSLFYFYLLTYLLFFKKS